MPPFRAEQIGSFFRPQKLKDAFDAVDAASDADKASANDHLLEVRRGAVADFVQSQLKHNVRPITDGEFSRFNFMSGFYECFEGIESQLGAPISNSRPYNPVTAKLLAMGRTEVRQNACTGKIEHRPTQCLSDWMDLRSNLPQNLWKDCKICLPSPSVSYITLKPGKCYNEDVYKTNDEYFADLSAAFGKELRAVYDAGVRSVQVDDPFLTFFGDQKFAAGLRSDGEDPDLLLGKMIKLHNDCIKDKPEDLHVGVHLCRGNFVGGIHFADTSYEPLSRLLYELDYGTLYLEYDTERSGSFSPLKHLPRNKRVVLGLVSTKSTELEKVDDLISRLYEAAEIIAAGQSADGSPRTREEVLRDNLAISPQCGFASMRAGGGVGVTEEIAWGKLKLLDAVVEKVWPGEK